MPNPIDEELIIAVADARLSSPNHWVKGKMETNDKRRCCMLGALIIAEVELEKWFGCNAATKEIRAETRNIIKQCIQKHPKIELIIACAINNNIRISGFNDEPDIKFVDVKQVMQCSVKEAASAKN
jgi:hypothetical protein